jgi:hypothetical protein
MQSQKRIKQMAETKKKGGWPKVGTLRKGDSGSYIKLEEGVEIFLNGEKLSMNEKRTVRLEDPRKKVEGLYERGFITEAEHDKRLESLANNEWLRYELILSPARKE